MFSDTKIDLVYPLRPRTGGVADDVAKKWREEGRRQKGMLFHCDVSTFGRKALKMPDTLFGIRHTADRPTDGAPSLDDGEEEEDEGGGAIINPCSICLPPPTLREFYLRTGPGQDRSLLQADFL